MPSRLRCLLSASVLFFLAFSRGPGPGTEDMSAADEKFLQENHVKTEGADLLAFLRDLSPDKEREQHLEMLVRQLGSNSYRLRERASHEVVEAGTPSLPFLRRAAQDVDPELARRANQCIQEIEHGPGPALPAAAVRLLAQRQPPGTVETLLRYAPFADDTLLQEEVLTALVAADNRPGKIDPTLPAALTDAVPARRAAAAYVLGRSPDEEQRAAVHKLLADAEPVVRLRAAQGLVAAREKDAVPVLVDLLTVDSSDISAQAEEGLMRLAGEGAPIQPSGNSTEETRKQWRDSWAVWWRDKGPTFDWAQVEKGEPYLNLTIVAQMSSGKVWEFGHDGKPRWTISDLQGPIDAWALPGGRVLIAEHNGRRVTERDLKGTVLWKKELNDRPVVCQRLANGNTFIATYSGVVEVARGGKEVYSYPTLSSKVGTIYAAQKLRNGHIVCASLAGNVLEIDSATGNEVRRLPGMTAGSGCYSLEGLAGDRFLMTDLNQGKVIEFNGKGTRLWECSVAGAYHAARLPNGSTLVSSHSQGKVFEVNRQGKVVWEQSTNGPVWRVHRR